MTLDPLAQIHFVTIAAIIGIALATMFLLRPIFFLPILEVMAQRAERIEAARSRKAEAEALLQGAERELDEALVAAKVEAARLAAQAMEEAAAVRRERLAKAGAEAEALLAAGRTEIAALRRTEDERLAEELRACAGQALTAMIGPVDEAAVQFVVNRVLRPTAAG